MHNPIAVTLARSWLAVACWVVLLSSAASAQTIEFFPEVDLHAHVNSSVRLSFQAKETIEAGDPTQAELGPSIDLHFKPLVQLRKYSLYDLDESKSRTVALSFGYRYVPSPGSAAVNRVILQATSNLPLRANLLLSDRNRGELNVSNGDLTWRYRNRLTIQRTLTVHSHHPTPYLSSESYYCSTYQKWSSTAVYTGVLLPVRSHTQFDLYYEHENNTGKKPNKQINAFGLVLSLQF